LIESRYNKWEEGYRDECEANTYRSFDEEQAMTAFSRACTHHACRHMAVQIVNTGMGCRSVAAAEGTKSTRRCGEWRSEERGAHAGLWLGELDVQIVDFDGKISCTLNQRIM
jgi:hypothetical protein